MKDWTKLAEKYAGQWVALAHDEETVLGSGRTLEEARAQALEAGESDPIFMRVPKKVLTYVGEI